MLANPPQSTYLDHENSPCFRDITTWVSKARGVPPRLANARPRVAQTKRKPHPGDRLGGQMPVGEGGRAQLELTDASACSYLGTMSFFLLNKLLNNGQNSLICLLLIVTVRQEDTFSHLCICYISTFYDCLVPMLVHKHMWGDTMLCICSCTKTYLYHMEVYIRSK